MCISSAFIQHSLAEDLLTTGLRDITQNKYQFSAPEASLIRKGI